MKRLAIVALALGLAGCEPVKTGDKLYIPPDLGELWSAVLSCRNDVEKVPLEHSEHCVIVGERLLDVTRPQCFENPSYECKAFSDAWGRISTIYNEAVIDSLLIHGPSPEIVRASGQASGAWSVYYSEGELLRRLFDTCVADEEHDLRAQGLVKVSSMRDTPLAPGQRCFRKGYPEFRTRKAALS